MSNNYFDSVVKHYEDCLVKHGDSYLGVDWPDADDANKRYKVMLDIITFKDTAGSHVSVLDFGCGAAHLQQYILDNNIQNINYTGLDISEKFVSLCKKKFPQGVFYCADILDSKTVLPMFDYIVINGAFTEKRELSFDDMWEYLKQVLKKIFFLANKGIAFNVMSKAVDWERDDLFHLPADLLIDFLTKNLSRNFVIRNDYGLYEYTTYIFK